MGDEDKTPICFEVRNEEVTGFNSAGEPEYSTNFGVSYNFWQHTTPANRGEVRDRIRNLDIYLTEKMGLERESSGFYFGRAAVTAGNGFGNKILDIKKSWLERYRLRFKITGDYRGGKVPLENMLDVKALNRVILTGEGFPEKLEINALRAESRIKKLPEDKAKS